MVGEAVVTVAAETAEAIEVGSWLGWTAPFDDGSLTFAVMIELTSVT